MSGKSEDRRIARTRNALWLALLDLLQDHDWNAITIQMICDRADTARSSFYSHFDNKAALLDFGFARSVDEMSRTMRNANGSSARFQTLDWLVDHIGQNFGFARRTAHSASGQVLFLRFRRAVAKVFANEL